MKKVFLIMLCFGISQMSFAQILQIESCNAYSKTEEQFLAKSKTMYYSTIILSNGDKLKYTTRFGWDLQRGPNSTQPVWSATCNLDYKKKYAKGTLVYKYPSGDKFELVEMKKVGTYTIKKVVIREINVELNANADFSYKSFWGFVGIIGGGGSTTQVQASAKGGVKTVVNVIFTNNETASIIAADDPIWLEASPGQQVEHYKVRDYNIYKLIF